MKYKLSRKLTAPERASLKEAHASLSKALAAVSEAQKTIGANETKLKKMEKRAATLEKEAARGSAVASSELMGIKDQIERARMAISKNAKSAGNGGSLKAALNCSIEIVRQISLEDIRSQVHDLFEERLADFYFDVDRARGIAAGCDALEFLWNAFRGNPHSPVEADVLEAGKFSAIINHLLKGETFWEFPAPKAGAKSKSR